MRDLGEFIERYVGVWNEPDAARRRQSVAALWTEDAAHFTRTIEARGHQEIAARVTRAHDEFVASGRYRFRPHAAPEEHHGGVRFAWEMVPADGGPVAAVGTTLMLLAADGRIRLEYQFPDPTPA
ncbi:MAG TPA: nuclear transport factor 2 family protein [Candidatus Binatia bacterium]|nr:nuclear transport factor 2 family protein [Candidatus Binatia bacterium]